MNIFLSRFRLLIEQMNFNSKKNLLNLIFLLLSVGMLTAGFYNNKWGVADEKIFDHFQEGSESLVIGRLIMDQDYGLFLKGGLLGRFEAKRGEAVKADQYRIYEDNVKMDSARFGTYNSQSAGQGMTLGVLQKLSWFSNATNIRIFRLCVSVLSALAFSLFLFWVVRNFGWASAIISLLLILLSYWLTLFGRNLYWCLWAFYVPFLTMLLLLEKESRKGKHLTPLKIGIALVAALSLKCFYTGFEYITTTLVMMVTPFVFYAVIDRWEIKKTAIRLGTAVVSSLLVILLSFVILAYQISFVRGNLKSGFKLIAYNYFKRTSGNPSEFKDVYRKSLESPVSHVLQTYWNGAAFDFTDMVPGTTWRSLFIIDYGELLLILMIFSALVFVSGRFFPSIAQSIKRSSALLTTLWLSILAPLSWFVIFKAHSFIHVKMNFIVWYMPFALFGFVLIGSVSSLAFNDCLQRFRKASKSIQRAIFYPLLALFIAFLIYVNTRGLPEYRLLRKIEKQQVVHDAKSGFDVVLYNNALWYIKNNATGKDMNSKFFLHVVPEDTKNMSGSNQENKFVNLDFAGPKNRMFLPWWSGYASTLFIRVDLPRYEIQSFVTGQHDSRGSIWRLTSDEWR